MLFDDQGIRRWIERRAFECPGCGSGEDWAFDRADAVVTLPLQSFETGIGSLRTTSFAGGNVEKAMRTATEKLQEASRSTSNQVVKLPCGNCGYVIFLDGKKLF